MIREANMLEDFVPNKSSSQYITFGDNSRGKACRLGKVVISKDRSISNVMHVQSLGFNLLSVAQLTDLNLCVLFTKSNCRVFSSSDWSEVFVGERKENLYLVDFTQGPQINRCLLAKSSLGWL